LSNDLSRLAPGRPNSRVTWSVLAGLPFVEQPPGKSDLGRRSAQRHRFLRGIDG